MMAVVIVALFQNYQEQDIYRLVYFGGVAPTLRKEVWPFLLGHYNFTMTEKSRMEVSSYLSAVTLKTLIKNTLGLNLKRLVFSI